MAKTKQYQRKTLNERVKMTLDGPGPYKAVCKENGVISPEWRDTEEEAWQDAEDCVNAGHVVKIISKTKSVRITPTLIESLF